MFFNFFRKRFCAFVKTFHKRLVLLGLTFSPQYLYFFFLSIQNFCSNFIQTNNGAASAIRYHLCCCVCFHSLLTFSCTHKIFIPQNLTTNHFFHKKLRNFTNTNNLYLSEVYSFLCHFVSLYYYYYFFS